MLNVDSLKDQICMGIKNIIVPAIKETIRTGYPQESDIGNEISEEQSSVFDDLVSEQFADVLANAIDYYVKNMAIEGTIITNGGPTTQIARINANPIPKINGKLPNTLGIR